MPNNPLNPTGGETMTKADIIEAAGKMARFLDNNTHTPDEIAEFERLNKEYGHIPAVQQIKDDNYDRRAVHKGFGSPDCSCHINPPCQACIDWTNYCADREEAVEVRGEPGCMLIDHDCEVVRNPA